LALGQVVDSLIEELRAAGFEIPNDHPAETSP